MTERRAKQLADHIGGLRREFVPVLGINPSRRKWLCLVRVPVGPLVCISSEEEARQFYDKRHLGEVPKAN